MFESQIEERKNFRYPPFYRLIRISLKHKESQLLNEGANVFADLLRPELGSRVLGPEFPLIGRIKNLYIKDVLIKFEVKASHLAVKKMIREAVDRFFKIKIYRSILFSLDVDPY
jgi:primosomal protein N' (replication factor Y)